MGAWTPAPPGSKKYSIIVDPKTDEGLAQLADLDLCPKSSIIRRALRDYVASRRAELEPVSANGGAHAAAG